MLNETRMCDSELAHLAEQLQELVERVSSARAHARVISRRYSIVWENAPVGIALFRPDEAGEFRLTEANPAYYRLLDPPYRQGEAQGMRVRDFVPGFEKEGQADFRQVMETGQPRLFQEFTYAGMQRGITYWDTTLYPLPGDQGNAGVLMLVVDVTHYVTARERAKLAEAEKRAFYRNVVYAITGGKLRLLDTRPAVPDGAPTYPLLTPLNAHAFRGAVRQAAQAAAMAPERILALEQAVGEAALNAIRYGRAGEGHVFRGGNTVCVNVSDQGPGISSLMIPQSTLMRGFSTGASLGMGFTIMLDQTDVIYLYTGLDGTAVVLEKALAAPVADPCGDGAERGADILKAYSEWV